MSTGELLCALLFLAAAGSGAAALGCVVRSALHTAPGTSTWTALTRGAFLHRKHFTERGWRLRGRGVLFALLACALMAAFFFTCAELE